jgi:hypothetical protein
MGTVTASDWMKGIGLSVTASVVGGASKLAIRKSWVMISNQTSSTNRHHPEDGQKRIIGAAEDNGDSSSHLSPQERARREGGYSFVESSSRRSSLTIPPSGTEQDSAHIRSSLLGDTKTDVSKCPSAQVSNATPSNFRSSSVTTTRRRTSPTVVRSLETPFMADRNISASTSSHSVSDHGGCVPQPITNIHDKDEESGHQLDHNKNDLPSTPSKLVKSRSKNVPLLMAPSPPSKKCKGAWSVSAKSRALRYCGMFGMTVLNPICCVWAMQFASPSILAPFSGLTLVWIIVFSGCVIGERPSQAQIFAAGWIVIGEVIVALWGDHTNETGHVETLDEILNEYKSFGVLFYFGALGVWMSWIGYVIYQSRKSVPTPVTPNGDYSELRYSRRCDWSLGASNPNIRRLVWGVAGGSLTGLQNFLKDALTILKISEANMDQQAAAAAGGIGGFFSKTMFLVKSLPPVFFVFFAFAAASSFIGLLLLTACMRRYDATYSAAMFVGSFVLSASFMAAVRYHTFAHLDGIWNYIFYPTGLLILLLGIYVLATLETDTSSTSHGENHDDSSAVEQKQLSRLTSDSAGNNEAKLDSAQVNLALSGTAQHNPSTGTLS